MATPAQQVAQAPQTQQDLDVSAEEQKQQQEIRETLDKMVQAFNEFHGQIEQLKKQQQDVIRHIRSRIDQEKIEQIKTLLKGERT